MPPLRRPIVIRRIVVVRGTMRFIVDVAPRFDYARSGHEIGLTPQGAVFSSRDLTLGLSTPL